LRRWPASITVGGAGARGRLVLIQSNGKG